MKTIYIVYMHIPFMPSFVVEVGDANGRQGVLNIGGNDIITPVYVPSDDVCQAVSSISYDPHCPVPALSECDVWIRQSDIVRMRRHPEEKKVMGAAVCERMDRMQSSGKMLHFNFFSDVSGVQKETLLDLLRLQCRAGADVIEIPHVFCNAGAYERAVRDALDWQQNIQSGAPLMGIAHTTSDLAMLNRYLPQLGGIGIDCRRFDMPLLSQVKKSLKEQDVWVHAFSSPLQYHEVQNQGTLGMLINWFGVDTVSTFALSDSVRKYFTDSALRTEGQEMAEFVRLSRYFAPTDYSTYTFGMMEDYYGRGRHLSDFCGCPVCRNLTVGDVVEGLPDFYLMNRMHRAYAYSLESQNYQRALVNNETDLFLSGKPYAAEIIRRSSGTPMGGLPGAAPTRKADTVKGRKSRVARQGCPLLLL